jgi:outer membrane lipoprotein SlyB
MSIVRSSSSATARMPRARRWLAIGAAVSALAITAGCATGNNSNSGYTRTQAQREQTVRIATVESVREVMIDAGQTGIGAGTGAVVGGVAGSTMGGGRGQILTTVLGAVVGGIAGQAVEGNTSKRRALEITVEYANGDLRAITQDADEVFRPGERVRVMSGGGVTRVTH